MTINNRVLSKQIAREVANADLDGEEKKPATTMTGRPPAIA